MSLIHDALRKAAEENQNRHGQRDRPASWRDVAPPPPPRRSPWPWVTATVALAAGGVLLGWIQLRPAAVTPVPSPTVAVAPPEVAPPTLAPAPEMLAPQPPVSQPPVSQTAAIEPAATAPSPAPPPAPPAVAESRPAAVAAESSQPAPAPPRPAERPAPQPPVEPAAAPAPPAPLPERTASATPPNPAAPKLIVPPVQTGQVEGDTYVLEAEVGGKRLLLDFIVWSDSPFAQINGRQVGIGQQVEGFVVTDIARDSVLLETPTQRVRLKVR